LPSISAPTCRQEARRDDKTGDGFRSTPSRARSPRDGRAAWTGKESDAGAAPPFSIVEACCPNQSGLGAPGVIGSIAAIVVFVIAGLALSAWSMLRRAKRSRAEDRDPGARGAGASNEEDGDAQAGPFPHTPIE